MAVRLRRSGTITCAASRPTSSRKRGGSGPTRRFRSSRLCRGCKASPCRCRRVRVWRRGLRLRQSSRRAEFVIDTPMTASATIASAFDPALVARIPYAFAQTHGVLAYGNEGESVVVLLRPDATVDGIAEVKRVLNRPLLTRAIAADAFAAELARAYNQGGALAWSDDAANESDLTRLLQDLPPAEDLLDTGAQAPVIRMIHAPLLQGLRERASDLHFEPYEARSVVRFRVDGVLRDIIEPPRALH